MARSSTAGRSDGGAYGGRYAGASGDLPTWTNVLLTADTPIRWETEDGEPEPGDELAGRLVIGPEDQLIIDLCGAAASNLLAALLLAHHDARVPFPPCPAQVHPSPDGVTPA